MRKIKRIAFPGFRWAFGLGLVISWAYSLEKRAFIDGVLWLGCNGLIMAYNGGLLGFDWGLWSFSCKVWGGLVLFVLQLHTSML